VLAAAAAVNFDPKKIQTNLVRALELETMHKVVTERGWQPPLFYPGSILKVQYSNPGETFERSFVGICVAIHNRGVATNFVLRNSFSGVTVEKRFQTFAPNLKSIQVLDLSRRRKSKLYYLRNRPAKVGQG
jgi:large subunit ribosomal protein L19